MRIALAAVAFIGLTLLLSGLWSAEVRPFTAWLAQLQLLPAILRIFSGVGIAAAGIVVVLLLITWLFGRVYCSILCPLGVMQDIFTWLGNRRFWRSLRMPKWLGGNRFRYEQARHFIRYSILVLFVVLLIVWHPVASLIAPYSAYGRIVAALMMPLHQALPYAGQTLVMYIGLLSFVGIGLWAFVRGRDWCNIVCPVGTFLGMLSRHSLYAPVIDTNKCNSCGQCARNCKARCIDAKEHTIDGSRCVDCFDCIGNCHQGAISFGKRKKTAAQPADAKIDESRRRFLGVVGMLGVSGIVSAVEHKTDGGLAVIEDKQVPTRAVPLRPAGSMSLKHFTDHCTGCQLCVQACPNNVLRPSTDLSTLLQPEMQFDHGYCMVTCHTCADVCPTGAISPIQPEEKSAIRIGKAVWIADNCVVNTDGVSCGNCERHCPSGAIIMVPHPEKEGLQIPTIDTERCIGCGHCEYVCPSRPFSAIYVEGYEQHRK